MFLQMDTPSFVSQSVGLFDIMQKGGSLMWLILGSSILAIGVFIERVFYYYRSHLRVGEYLVGILNLVRKQNYLEALERCEEGYGPIKIVVQRAILSRNLPSNELREVVREVAQLQVPKLEANLPILATIGYISPLLGLLGTVMGMIDAFIQINQKSGAAGVSDLAGGIWTALITTAAGLVVAIPCYVAYNYLIIRCHHLTNDMERAGIELIHALIEPPAKEVIDFKTAAASETKTTTPPVSISS